MSLAKIACRCGRGVEVIAGSEAIPTSSAIIASAAAMGWQPDPVQLGAWLCRECGHAGAKARTTPAPAASFDDLEDALADLVSAAIALSDVVTGETLAELTRARERVNDVVTAREQQTAGEVAAELAEVMAGRARAHKANAEFLLARSQPKTRGRAS